MANASSPSQHVTRQRTRISAPPSEYQDGSLQRTSRKQTLRLNAEDRHVRARARVKGDCPKWTKISAKPLSESGLLSGLRNNVTNIYRSRRKVVAEHDILSGSGGAEEYVSHLTANSAHRRGVLACAPSQALRHGSLNNCEAEIRELGGSLLVDQNVLTLDITVGDPMLMQEE